MQELCLYTVGLVFAILGGLLFVISFFRARQSNHDFADRPKEAAYLDGAIKVCSFPSLPFPSILRLITGIS